MRSSLRQQRGRGFIVLAVTTPLLGLTACASPALVAELQQDQQAYEMSRDRLSADETAGNSSAIATDTHLYKIAVTKLREDRGLCTGPNCAEKQEKQGRVRP